MIDDTDEELSLSSKQEDIPCIWTKTPGLSGIEHCSIHNHDRRPCDRNCGEYKKGSQWGICKSCRLEIRNKEDEKEVKKKKKEKKGDKYKLKYDKKKIKWDNKRNTLKKYIVHLELLLDDNKICHQSLDVFKSKKEDLPSQGKRKYDGNDDNINKKKKKLDDKEKECDTCKVVKPIQYFQKISRKYNKELNGNKIYYYTYTTCNQCKKIPSKKEEKQEIREPQVLEQLIPIIDTENEISSLVDKTTNSKEIKENVVSIVTDKSKRVKMKLSNEKDSLKEYIENKYDKVSGLDGKPDETLYIKLNDFIPPYHQYLDDNHLNKNELLKKRVINIETFEMLGFTVSEKVFCRHCENLFLRKENEPNCCESRDGKKLYLRVICGIKEKNDIKK